MKTLFFIYTNPRFMDALYQPVMSEAYDGREDVRVRFVCDNSLLLDSLEHDAVPTEQVKRRLERLIDNAADAGADCIVVGCTVLNTATGELAAGKKVPVFNIDAPMIQKICQDGCKRVAVFSHAPDNARTIERQLVKQGIKCSLFVIPSGEEADFLRQARNLDDSFDGLALAHISADRMQFSDVQIPVYRSGELCIRRIDQTIFEGEGK